MLPVFAISEVKSISKHALDVFFFNIAVAAIARRNRFRTDGRAGDDGRVDENLRDGN